MQSNVLGSPNSSWLQLDVGSSNERSRCFRGNQPNSPGEFGNPEGRLRSRLPRAHAQGSAAWPADAARSAATCGSIHSARDDARQAYIAGPLSHRLSVSSARRKNEHSGQRRKVQAM